MSSRTTRSFVTFVHPFVIDDDIGELPAGTYEIVAEDEILQSPVSLPIAEKHPGFWLKEHEALVRHNCYLSTQKNWS